MDVDNGDGVPKHCLGYQPYVRFPHVAEELEMDAQHMDL